VKGKKNGTERVAEGWGEGEREREREKERKAAGG